MSRPPNLIFVITDQQRCDTIAALGFPHMDTNIGKMHTWPFETPLGFDEPYVVENKDRYLEGRYDFDEWDKTLAARGLIKQQRELYRQLPDYRQRLGAFEWKLPEETHPDVFGGKMAQWWLQSYPRTEPLFLQIGFPGPHPPSDPVPRYAEPYLQKELPLLDVTGEELEHNLRPSKNSGRTIKRSITTRSSSISATIRMKLTICGAIPKRWKRSFDCWRIRSGLQTADWAAEWR